MIISLLLLHYLGEVVDVAVSPGKLVVGHVEWGQGARWRRVVVRALRSVTA
jgi:hypothetical protein